MAKFIFFFFVTFFVVQTVVGDICHLDSCKKKGQQTLCKFKNPRPAQSCGEVGTAGVSSSAKAEIVRAHNKFRKMVADGLVRRGNPGPQPRGIIPPLKWDDELATVAQRWANQCTHGHDECRDVARFPVGQNAARKSHSEGYVSNYTAMVQQWFDEVDVYPNFYVKGYKTTAQSTGHYTQLVWGKSLYVGCGLVQHKLAPKKFQTSLICNYGPGGNVKGQPVYELR